MATSGDYRNYFEYNLKKYSHILDPRTGYPIEPNVTLATVIAPDCMTADGLATALMVLRPQESIALVEQMEGIECLIVVRANDGTLVDPPFTSSGMAAFFVP
jgi:thiamine biosynthesis lipoprotein